MIQRIQSIWLLAAAGMAALTFRFPFYTGNQTTGETAAELKYLLATSHFLLLILTSLLVMGCFILIFLFKNRKLQFRLSLVAIAVSVINLVIYFSEIKKFSAGVFSLSAVFSFLIPVFLILAARGIWKDEQLVKSLDRLR